MLASALLAGLALGSMYGLLALGYHVTYAVSGTVNFAQGSAMMLGAVFAYGLIVVLKWPLVPAVACATWHSHQPSASASAGWISGGMMCSAWPSLYFALKSKKLVP